MGRNSELVACSNCADSFERKLGEGWKALCLRCWLARVIDEKHAKAATAPIQERITDWVIGPRYVPSGCDCTAAPWVACKHSFREYRP